MPKDLGWRQEIDYKLHVRNQYSYYPLIFRGARTLIFMFILSNLTVLCPLSIMPIVCCPPLMTRLQSLVIKVVD